MADDHQYIHGIDPQEIGGEVEIGDVEKPPFDVDEFKRSLMGDMMSLIRRELGEKRQCNEDDEVSLHADKYRAIENTQSDVSSENNPRAESFENENYSDLFQNKSPEKTTSHNSLKGVVQPCEPRLDITEEILSQVDKEMPAAVELGPDIKENLAKRIVVQFKERSQKTEVKRQICKNYIVPGNCASLAVPKINPPILGMKSFSEYHKRTERALYDTQLTLLKASSAVIEIANSLLVADETSKIADTKKLVKNSLDAITLIGSASSEISNRRKQNIRPTLQPNFRELCSSTRPVTEFLLGDDLQKGMKEAQEANKLQNLTSGSSGYNSRRYENSFASTSFRSKQDMHARNKKSFLEKGKNPQQSHRKFHSNQSNRKR